jgi:Zn-dependent protease
MAGAYTRSGFISEPGRRFVFPIVETLALNPSVLLSRIKILLSLSLHEASHGYVAYKLGDPTAKNLGRLTLNPAKHLDPIGFICMLLLCVGYAKPVPINTRYFKNPRRDMAICAVAGPAANVLLGLFFGILLRLFGLLIELVPSLIASESALLVVYLISMVLTTGMELNVMLALFNLIPVPSLDGSRVLYMFLSQKALMFMLRYEQYITIVFLGLLVFERRLPIAPIHLYLNTFTDLIVRLFKLLLFF